METTSGRLNVVKDEQGSYFQVSFAPIGSRGGSADFRPLESNH
jgi:hypothetical protein